MGSFEARMSDYPLHLTPVNHIEPVPRRIRAVLAGETVLDSTRVRYVWEWPNYPQYYVPWEDVRTDFLVPEGFTQHSPRGVVDLHGLQVGDRHLRRAARLLRDATVAGLENTVRFEWEALDAWFEEDERVFVHPRNPYAHVDAVRSTRRVRIESEGVVIADSSSPVMVFETGLPTRYYLNRTEVDFRYLVRSDTVTACPYKGTTSRYWGIRIGERVQPDLAWVYDFPSLPLLPIAGLIAFYNEKVDVFVDGEQQQRPTTHFFRTDH